MRCLGSDQACQLFVTSLSAGLLHTRKKYRNQRQPKAKHVIKRGEQFPVADIVTPRSGCLKQARPVR